jgi:hypothetical protein
MRSVWTGSMDGHEKSDSFALSRTPVLSVGSRDRFDTQVEAIVSVRMFHGMHALSRRAGARMSPPIFAAATGV